MPQFRNLKFCLTLSPVYSSTSRQKDQQLYIPCLDLEEAADKAGVKRVQVSISYSDA